MYFITFNNQFAILILIADDFGAYIFLPVKELRHPKTLSIAIQSEHHIFAIEDGKRLFFLIAGNEEIMVYQIIGV